MCHDVRTIGKHFNSSKASTGMYSTISLFITKTFMSLHKQGYTSRKGSTL